MKVAETPAGNQQRETVHGPPFYVADLIFFLKTKTKIHRFDVFLYYFCQIVCKKAT